MNSTTLKTMINQSIKNIRSNYYSGDIVGRLSVKSLINYIYISFGHIVNCTVIYLDRKLLQVDYSNAFLPESD